MALADTMQIPFEHIESVSLRSTEQIDQPKIIVTLDKSVFAVELDKFPLEEPNGQSIVEFQTCSSCSDGNAKTFVYAGRKDTNADISLKNYFFCDDCMSHLNTAVSMLTERNSDELVAEFI